MLTLLAACSVDRDVSDQVDYRRFMSLLDWQSNPVESERSEVCVCACTCVCVCTCTCVRVCICPSYVYVSCQSSSQEMRMKEIFIFVGTHTRLHSHPHALVWLDYEKQLIAKGRPKYLCALCNISYLLP